MKVTITLLDTPDDALAVNIAFDPPLNDGDNVPRTQATFAAQQFMQFLKTNAKPVKGDASAN
jgi:hypothetical protein